VSSPSPRRGPRRSARSLAGQLVAGLNADDPQLDFWKKQLVRACTTLNPR
jgi:hypothetical protein